MALLRRYYFVVIPRIPARSFAMMMYPAMTTTTTRLREEKIPRSAAATVDEDDAKL